MHLGLTDYKSYVGSNLGREWKKFYEEGEKIGNVNAFFADPLGNQCVVVLKDGYHVFVNRDKCDGLRESGMAMGEQTRPIDRTRIVKKIGAISDEALFNEIVRASEAIITDYK